MDWREHITVNPAVLRGKACIRGTRIPVAVVLANLADGLSAEEILKSYPTLTAAGIHAALAHAADLAHGLRSQRSQVRILPQREGGLSASAPDGRTRPPIIVALAAGNPGGARICCAQPVGIA